MDTPNPAKGTKRGLEERLKAHPALNERMHEIMDEAELTAKQGGSLDDAEERIVQLVRGLGREMVDARAQRILSETPPPPGLHVHRHSKKKSAG